MKVKGWAIINKDTKEIILTATIKPKIIVLDMGRGREELILEKNTEHYFSTREFKVKPCTITIHDKAVKG